MGKQRERLERIAKAISDNTSWHVTADMVTKLSDYYSRMEVHAAQVRDVTILCWAHGDGSFSFKHICW